MPMEEFNFESLEAVQRNVMIFDPLKGLPKPEIFSNVSWHGRDGEKCA
jgi:hypothetical protein